MGDDLRPVLRISLGEFLQKHLCLLAPFPKRLRRLLRAFGEPGEECGIGRVQVLPVLSTAMEDRDRDRATPWYIAVSSVLGIRRQRKPLYIEVVDGEDQHYGIDKRQIVPFTIPLVAYALQGLFTRSYCRARIAALTAALLYAHTVKKLYPNPEIRSRAHILAQALSEYLELSSTRSPYPSRDGFEEASTDIFLLLARRARELADLEEKIESTSKNYVNASKYRRRIVAKDLRKYIEMYAEKYRQLASRIIGTTPVRTQGTRRRQAKILVPGLNNKFNITINASYLLGMASQVKKWWLPKHIWGYSSCRFTPFLAVAIELNRLDQYWGELLEYAAVMALLYQGYKPLPGHRSFVVGSGTQQYSDEIDFAGYKGDEAIVLEVKTSLNNDKLNSLVDRMKKRAEKVAIQLADRGIKVRTIKVIIAYQYFRNREAGEPAIGADTQIQLTPLSELLAPLCNKSILITRRLCRAVNAVAR